MSAKMGGIERAVFKLAGAGLFLSLAYLWAGDLGFLVAAFVLFHVFTA